MAYNPYQKPTTATLNSDSILLPPSPTVPWLLYAWPWAPYPRRIMIYLREKGIPESQVKVVHVQGNDVVTPDCPPRPEGSLPLLAIPTQQQAHNNTPFKPVGTHDASQGHSYTYIRQSLAIMTFLDEVCNDAKLGFLPGKAGSLIGTNTARGSKPAQDALYRARMNEILALADELTTAWNPVRTYGTGAGTMKIPEAAKEMLRWVRRSLATVERYFQDRDMAELKQGVYGHVTIADIVLYQFFEFVEDCYGVDMTIGSGEIVKDVYGRDVKEEFPKLVEFYRTFKTRDSAKRDAEKGEVPPDWALAKMKDWVDDVL